MAKWEDIVKANKSIATTDIKGKDYAEVNQRIKAFRMVHPEGGIATDIISLENGVCVIKASVFDSEGKLLGSGTAYEKENSTFINKTSYIENCETSAVGRALGMCGFGIDTSVASYEEVATAIANQEEKPKRKAKQAEEEKYCCEVCGKEFEPQLYNGKVYSPKEISDSALMQRGRRICKDCFKKEGK